MTYKIIEYDQNDILKLIIICVKPSVCLNDQSKSPFFFCCEKLTHLSDKPNEPFFTEPHFRGGFSICGRLPVFPGPI